MSFLSDLQVAGTQQISGPGGLRGYASDGSLLSPVVSIRGAGLTISKADGRIYAINFVPPSIIDIFDATGTLVGTAVGGDGARDGFEVDAVCLGCPGTFWAFAAYGDEIPGHGSSIYEYRADGSLSRVITADKLSATDDTSQGTSSVWSAAVYQGILYWIGLLGSTAIGPANGRYPPGNGRDYDGSIHRFDVVNLVDLPDLQPPGHALYVALAIDPKTATLYASINNTVDGAWTPPLTLSGTDKVEVYALPAETLTTTFTNADWNGIYGIALSQDGTAFLVGDVDSVANGGAPAISKHDRLTGALTQVIDVASWETYFAIAAPEIAWPVVSICPPPTPGTITDVPIRRQRTSPHLWDGTSARRLTYPGFQLLTESGAPRDTDTPLSFTLEWSDDGGHHWSNLHTITGSTLGQFLTRFRWLRLGVNRLGGDRVFRLTNSDDAKIVLIDALLAPDPVEGSS